MVTAIALTTILGLLSLLHIYWAVGGTWGMEVAVPEEDGKKAIDPGPVACLLVATALGIAAFMPWVSTVTGGWIPHAMSRWGLWGLSAIFLLRSVGDFRYVGLFKKIRNSRFAWWDTRLFVPLCLVVAWLAAMSASGLT